MPDSLQLCCDESVRVCVCVCKGGGQIYSSGDIGGHTLLPLASEVPSESLLLGQE